MYEPTSLPLIRVRSRVSDATWEQRVEQASRDEIVIKRILAEETKGRSLNEAIAKVLPADRRSWALRRIPNYREQGFEALIDARLPREANVALSCRQAVQAAREANPRITVDETLEILGEQGITPLPSESTIKREFARVKEQRKYARRKAVAQGRTEVIELPLAGGELLAAAETETGGIAALTNEVVRIAEEALEASKGKTPAKDLAGRNDDGQFTARYNRARRRKRGEQIASYLRTAEEKAGRACAVVAALRSRATRDDRREAPDVGVRVDGRGEQGLGRAPGARRCRAGVAHGLRVHAGNAGQVRFGAGNLGRGSTADRRDGSPLARSCTGTLGTSRARWRHSTSTTMRRRYGARCSRRAAKSLTSTA